MKETEHAKFDASYSFLSRKELPSYKTPRISTNIRGLSITSVFTEHNGKTNDLVRLQQNSLVVILCHYPRAHNICSRRGDQFQWNYSSVRRVRVIPKGTAMQQITSMGKSSIQHE